MRANELRRHNHAIDLDDKRKRKKERSNVAGRRIREVLWRVHISCVISNSPVGTPPKLVPLFQQGGLPNALCFSARGAIGPPTRRPSSCRTVAHRGALIYKYTHIYIYT